MKRILTKVFWGEHNVAAEGAMAAVGTLDKWLLQEAIEVVGAEVMVQSAVPSENDGFAHIEVELSQAGAFGADGAILVGGAGEGWNTVPQGIQGTNANATIAFPAGYAVPVRDEGYLYINYHSQGKSANVSKFTWEVIVHYIKKG
ncbi:hypothetical protein ES703_108803 [subsurface metagenome]